MKELVFSWRMAIYVGVCLLFFILDRLVLARTLTGLRKFEADAEEYDQQMQLVVSQKGTKADQAMRSGL